MKGSLSKYVTYEDNDFLGFLDIHPLTKGNSLLVPKNHYRWVYDVPKFGKYWQIAQKIALSSIETLSAQSVSFLTLGYEVPHAHIRIIPRFPNDAHQNGVNVHHQETFSENDMLKIAQSIKENIK